MRPWEDWGCTVWAAERSRVPGDGRAVSRAPDRWCGVGRSPPGFASPRQRSQCQRYVAERAAGRRSQTIDDRDRRLLGRRRVASDALIGFLERHRDRPIYLSTPDPKALAYLHQHAPWVRPRLSLTSQARLDALVQNGPPSEGLTGVSVRASLLAKGDVAAIENHGLFMLAYSANDMPRVNTLAEWGVEGITTDSLSVVRALASNNLIPVV